MRSWPVTHLPLYILRKRQCSRSDLFKKLVFTTATWKDIIELKLKPRYFWHRSITLTRLLWIFFIRFLVAWSLYIFCKVFEEPYFLYASTCCYDKNLGQNLIFEIESLSTSRLKTLNVMLFHNNVIHCYYWFQMVINSIII